MATAMILPAVWRKSDLRREGIRLPKRTGVDLALHEEALHVLDERRHPQHAPRPPLAPQAEPACDAANYSD